MTGPTITETLNRHCLFSVDEALAHVRRKAAEA